MTMNSNPNERKMVPFRGGMVSEGWPERLAAAQAFPRVHIGRRTYDRIPCREEQCHDCAAVVGEYHVPGCDNEYCPACGGQLWMGGCTCTRSGPVACK